MTKEVEIKLSWMVEYNFMETPWGSRPEWLKTGFKTEAEALAWAAENTTDGKVIGFNSWAC